jgi:hypothetical protein
MQINLIFFMLLGTSIYAQVGINNRNPQATLDISGDLVVRSILLEADKSLAKDSIIITNGGLIKKAAIRDLINEEFKTTVKGSFSNTGTLNLSLLTGASVIPFNLEEFDYDGSYNTTTYEFTAKITGIYHVTSQIKFSSTLDAATNLGIRVVKNGVVVHRESFANVIILGTNVTPPKRKICTLLELTENDVLHFEVEGDVALGSINIEGDNTHSYFAINRRK